MTSPLVLLPLDRVSDLSDGESLALVDEVRGLGAGAEKLNDFLSLQASGLAPGLDVGIDHVVLRIAANPFDHDELIEEGIAAYEKCSDARVEGKLLDIRRLVFDGLRSGRLDLCLILARFDEEAHVEIAPPLNPGVVPVPGPLQLGGDPALTAGENAGSDPGLNGGAVRILQAVDQNTGIGKQVEMVHPFLLSSPTIVAGFDILSKRGAFLSGHILFLKPEFRGKGLVSAYFEAALEMARASGLDGMIFASTLERWKKRPEMFTITGSYKQQNGVEVNFYRRTV